MDLHFTAAEPDPEEAAAVDACLSEITLNGGDLRQYLLPVLHALQDRRGWISPGALNYACRRLEVPPPSAALKTASSEAQSRIRFIEAVLSGVSAGVIGLDAWRSRRRRPSA